MSALLLVDTGNLFFCTGKRFGKNKRIDYAKYVERCLDFYDVTDMMAFVSQNKNESLSFLKYLKTVGFEDVVVRRQFRKKVKNDFIYYTNWSAEMAWKAARFDGPVIIGSSNVEVFPLLELLKRSNRDVIVYASGIPDSFKEVATCYEIDEDIMKDLEESVLSAAA